MIVSAIVNDLRYPQVRIFLSHIFLPAKPKQENVGEENKSERFLKSSADLHECVGGKQPVIRVE
jgi:hypothetical protein